MEAELIGFIIAGNIVLLILIGGIVFFIFQYRRRRRVFESEKIEARLRHEWELLNMQLETQKETMQLIGQEIHDNVGQQLTLASLYARQHNPEQNKERLEEIAGIIDKSLHELRQLSKSLTHPEQAGSGLLTMLRATAKRISASGFCFVEIIADEEQDKLGVTDKHILFRLLQEFIQNSLKHAQCRKVTITLNYESRVLHITAADDGVGFDTTIRSAGIGLQNMKRRAEQLHALYQLESYPGQGTRLTLKLPLRDEI